MTTDQKIIKNKLGLLNLAKTLCNVSEACKVIGYSRDSFYRFKELYESGGEEALKEVTRSKPNFKNRIDPDIEKAVLDMAIEYPAYGQVRISNELKLKGLIISPGGVRCVWLRNDLHNFKKRLQALEKKVAETNMILTDKQLQALERAKEEKIEIGEIETEHPGYLGAQDTFYVGTIKGVGRIYQQTFIDTYSKNTFVKLYDRKNALVAADLLNDKVVPFYEEHKIPLLRMLTDRGTEYCGLRESHEYQLFLSIENIDHSKTKAKNPQTNGICERFQRTMLNEFYQIAFRKKIYKSIDELQEDADKWIFEYNNNRPHSGKKCEGRTPIQTFKESLHLAKEKMIGYEPSVA